MKPLYLSPSQIDAYKRCQRCWWLKSVIKAPEPRKKTTIFGDIGHACCDRFLQGKEPFPEGWEYEINRWTKEHTGNKLTKAEQSLCKALITAGIKDGVLHRAPDSRTEQQFQLDVPDVDTPVKIKMFLDHLTTDAVEDHKFCGSTRYYSDKVLKNALAMNLYGVAAYAHGYVQNDSIWLRYNLFVKNADRPRTKVVEVERTAQEVKDYFDDLVVPSCQRMLHLVKRDIKRDDWSSVAGDMNDTGRACDAYGGCPYLPICSGRVTVDEFIKQQTEDKEERKTAEQDARILLFGGKKQQKEGGGKNMSRFLDKVRSNAAAGTPPAEQAGQQEPDTPEEVTTAPVEEAPKQEAPKPTGLAAPWYREGCKACSGNEIKGLSSKKSPCAICCAMNKKEGGTTTEGYGMTVTDEGAVLITEEDTGEVVLRSGDVEVAPAKEKIVPKEEKKEPEQEQEPETEAKKEAPKEEKPKAKTAAPKEEEPKPEQKLKTTDTPTDAEFAREAYEQERMKMAISYAPVRQRQRTSKKLGESNCVATVTEVMELVAEGLLKSANAKGAACDDYYQLARGTRIDMISMNARAIADIVGSSTIDASGMQRGSDEAHLCFALERFAGMIYGSQQ